MELHTSAALPPENEPRYPLDRRLGGSQSWSGRSGEEKKVPARVAKRTPVVQLVA